MLTTFVECPFCGDVTQHLCLSSDGEFLLCQTCLHQHSHDVLPGGRIPGTNSIRQRDQRNRPSDG
jgi:hypothetical protein